MSAGALCPPGGDDFLNGVVSGANIFEAIPAAFLFFLNQSVVVQVDIAGLSGGDDLTLIIDKLEGEPIQPWLVSRGAGSGCCAEERGGVMPGSDAGGIDGGTGEFSGLGIPADQVALGSEEEPGIGDGGAEPVFASAEGIEAVAAIGPEQAECLDGGSLAHAVGIAVEPFSSFDDGGNEGFFPGDFEAGAESGVVGFAAGEGFDAAGLFVADDHPAVVGEWGIEPFLDVTDDSAAGPFPGSDATDRE